MTEKTPGPTQLPSNTAPHIEEVLDAQATADDAEKAAAPGSDVDADLEVLRSLVAAYGAAGVRRMIDSLK